LRTVEFSSLLKSLRYHLVTFFPLDHVHVQKLVLQIDSPHVMIIINHTQRLPCFLAFVRNPLVSAVRYVDTIVTFLLSCHFSTVTGPKCLAMISPFSSFLSFTSLGTFFLCSFSVPTQSVECSILSFLANSGLLKKLSIHSICPRSNKGSKNYSTIAAVLGVSGAIRLDCRTILFLICLSEIFLPLLCLQYHS